VLTSAVIVLELSYQPILTVLAQWPEDPLKVATALQPQPVTVRSFLTATLAAVAAVAGAPTTELTRGPAAEAIAAASAAANSHVCGASQGSFDARQKIEELRRKKSATVGDNDGFPTFSPRLCNLLLSDKFKPLGITKYDAKQDPIEWLRCYALSIENVGGNNDTKCLYFPFCWDQAPLTWLESLEKYSIDKWDQLKEQFTSNIAGAMGRSGTRMDLAMVKKEQGEPLF
jgi:hypothetical protein